MEAELSGRDRQPETQGGSDLGSTAHGNGDTDDISRVCLGPPRRLLRTVSRTHSGR